jgi:enoyl-CoA hydratase/carnithine racemase
MQYQTIRYVVKDYVATITLARPERLNAFTLEMQQELVHALDQVDADDNVRAVVVTGDGRAFCAGADLSGGTDSFDQRTTTTWKSDFGSPIAPDGTVDYSHPGIRDSGGRLTLRIFACLKPIIAAVNGPAVGIGATMLLAMDIRLSSSLARFGFVFSRRGVVPEAASSWFLARVVPMEWALEWCFTGRVFDADEALKGGLVRSVYAPDELLKAAYALAREIADNASPVSVALIRQMLWRIPNHLHPMSAHRIDSRLMFDRGKSLDAREGIASFTERRGPAFPDRVSEEIGKHLDWWPSEEGDW